MLIPYFRDLGNAIAEAWKQSSFDEDVFPDLALKAMEAHPPAEHVQVEEIIDWIFDDRQAFRQPDGAGLFGEPPIVVYQAPRFFIEALFWCSGTTDIHAHGFSGAFAVLAGSSVHSHWTFSPRERINSRMLTGELALRSTELLRPGAIREIRSGDRLIHQLFHLESPSVTIVVRTDQDPEHLPQYRYYPPGLAVEPRDHDALTIRRLIFLQQMARGRMDGLQDYASRMARDADIETFFHCLATLTEHRAESSLLDNLVEIARQRHGDLVDRIRSVCGEIQRTRRLIATRASVENPQARTLLALLMLMPDRRSLLDAVAMLFPDVDPLDWLTSATAMLGDKSVRGFEASDVNQAIFRHLARGESHDQLIEVLGRDFDQRTVSEHRDKLLAQAQNISKLDLYRPLFATAT